LNSIHPKNHELFALRLLIRRFPARSWEELRNHNGIIFHSSHETARHLGLVANRDHEAEICLQDASEINRPASDIRFLLALMVHYVSSRKPMEELFYNDLSDDEDDVESIHHKIELLLKPDTHTSLDVYTEDHIASTVYAELDSSLLTEEELF
jgi:hypothetical protein